MTDKQTPPDWVLIEAAKRFGWYDEAPEGLRQINHDGFRALCDMIEKYEQPPKDRKLLCAREAEAGMILYGNLSYTEVTENRENIARACVRAIELWESGYGK
jgi:hypothetical protein